MKKEKQPELPNNLQSSIQNLSGYSMDDVKVHYNSSNPSQLDSEAYSQGQEIHLNPGQPKHMAHQAWHIVQQKQGRGHIKRLMYKLFHYLKKPFRFRIL